MNDVKQICELALDVPPPPLREPAEALAIARRSARRRDRLAVVATAAGVVAVASVTAAVVTVDSPTEGRSSAPVAAAERSVAQRAAPTATVPSREAAHAHGRQIAQILLDAVPPGFEAAPEYSTEDGDPTSTWMLESPSNAYVSTTSIVVSDGGREGLLQAFILRDGKPALGGDLCSNEVADRIDPILGSATVCQVVVVGGVPIRVTSRNDPDIGATVTAVRLLQGGLLAVMSAQGRWTFDSSDELPPDAARSPAAAPATAPDLTSPVFTAEQVAAIAGNPAMLP